MERKHETRLRNFRNGRTEIKQTTECYFVARLTVICMQFSTRFNFIVLFIRTPSRNHFDT